MQVAAKKSSTIPIRVAPKPKPKCCKQSKNVFYNDRGFSNKTDKYDNCLHNIEGGVILRWRKSPVLKLDVIDPTFHYEFNEAFHGAQLAKNLDISHPDPTYAEQLFAMIKWYWSICDERRTFTSVRGYQCVIDTGNAKPIAVKKIMYGPKEMVIMRKSIAALAKSWSYPSDT